MSEDSRLKHLEFLQADITRQASNQFLIKGWTLTVATALCAYAANHNSALVAVLALLQSVVFLLLDAYYLRQERLYRLLWDAVASRHATVKSFSMDPTPYKADVSVRWRSVLASTPLLVLYGLTGVIAIVTLSTVA